MDTKRRRQRGYHTRTVQLRRGQASRRDSECKQPNLLSVGPEHFGFCYALFIEDVWSHLHAEYQKPDDNTALIKLQRLLGY